MTTPALSQSNMRSTSSTGGDSKQAINLPKDAVDSENNIKTQANLLNEHTQDTNQKKGIAQFVRQFVKNGISKLGLVNKKQNTAQITQERISTILELLQKEEQEFDLDKKSKIPQEVGNSVAENTLLDTDPAINFDALSSDQHCLYVNEELCFDLTPQEFSDSTQSQTIKKQINEDTQLSSNKISLQEQLSFDQLSSIIKNNQELLINECNNKKINQVSKNIYDKSLKSFQKQVKKLSAQLAALEKQKIKQEEQLKSLISKYDCESTTNLSKHVQSKIAKKQEACNDTVRKMNHISCNLINAEKDVLFLQEKFENYETKVNKVIGIIDKCKQNIKILHGIKKISKKTPAQLNKKIIKSANAIQKAIDRQASPAAINKKIKKLQKKLEYIVQILNIKDDLSVNNRGNLSKFYHYYNNILVLVREIIDE